MSEDAKYKVGLIGAGRAGVPRARAFDIHPLCEVVAIADTDRANLDLAAGRFGVPGYETWDEMLENHDLDIGMAVLPVRPNADAVVALAQAGVKTIFCEKPLTGSLVDADRMVEETSSRGVPLVCGVVVSSSPDYQKAYQLVAEGEIGSIVRINLYENNNQVGTHGLNLAQRFAGRPEGGLAIGWVSDDPFAEAEDEHEDGTPGYGAIGGYIRYDNEVEAFSNYRVPNHYWRGIEVVGTHGAIFNWNNSGLGLHLVKGKTEEPPNRMGRTSQRLRESSCHEMRSKSATTTIQAGDTRAASCSISSTRWWRTSRPARLSEPRPARTCAAPSKPPSLCASRPATATRPRGSP